MEILITYLIICPLVFAAGLVDAIAGGGGLISLPAYMIAGVPVHTAIATNKLSAGMGTTIATYRFAKNGYINWKQALPCVVFALVGSYLGAKITLLLSADVFRVVMVIILPLTAFYVMGKKSLQEDKTPYTYGKTLFLCAIISFCIGVYDGFYGPGTGTFLILLLTALAHIALTEAAGTTKVINLSTNISALTVFLANGVIDLQLGIIAGCFSIAGNYIGVKLFSEKGVKFVKPFMIGVLVIFFGKTIWEMIA